MSGISLCSYTYNDAALLHRLLSEVPLWVTPPDEIILVDDGSKQPFELAPEEKNLPVRLIRLEENQGFTRAKHTGMWEATGDIIVSLDCDVSLRGDFLRNAAHILLDDSIGLVAPKEGGFVKQDILSEYSQVLMPFKASDKNGEAKLINGPALAIRRRLWHEIDGYNGHEQTTGEDHYLNSRLVNMGYRLVIDANSQLVTTRAISRHIFCRRLWLVRRKLD